MKTKKVLALFLSISLVLTMMPMSVFAFEAAAPANVVITTTQDAKVKIAWDAVECAKEYQVDRYWLGFSDEMIDPEWQGVTAETEIADPDVLEVGAPYKYVVSAVFEDGSTVSSEPVSYFGKLPAPTVKVSAIASNGMNKVTWNKVEGAVGYYVEKKSSQDDEWMVTALTDERSIEDDDPDFLSPGDTISYRVKALYSWEGEEEWAPCDPSNSEYSKIVSRTVDLPRPVVTLSNLASSGNIKISWKAVKGATKYEVSRATSSGGTYKVIKTTTAKSYTDTTAATGKKYYYKVKALHKNAEVNSANSTYKSAYKKLAKPVITKATTSKGKPKLTWKKVSGAKAYTVYYKTGSGKYKSVKVTGTTWTHKKAVKGKTYTYKIKAVHKNSGANSADSATKKVKATR